MSKSNVNINLGSAPIFLIFLVLKLTETVDWSWWIITLPLWLPFAFLAAIMAIAAIGGAIALGVAAFLGRK